MFYTSHKRHNRIAEKAGTFFPIRYSEEGKSSRSHPWQVTPVWHIEEKLPSGGYWAAKVNPGLVNGIPAAITMAFEDAPTTAKTRIDEEAKKLNEKKPALTSTHDVFLDEQAEVKLVWRRIGADALPTGAVTGDAQTGVVTGVFEPVPPFFQALGVASAKTNLLEQQAETTRYLRACDLIVKQPRLAFANEITVGAVVNGSILSANPTFTVPKDRQPRVEALPKFVPLAQTPTVQELLVQRFADEPFDQFLLATVYALSAPNEQRPDLLLHRLDFIGLFPLDILCDPDRLACLPGTEFRSNPIRIHGHRRLAVFLLVGFFGRQHQTAQLHHSGLPWDCALDR